jgi:hypothetical protein
LLDLVDTAQVDMAPLLEDMQSKIQPDPLLEDMGSKIQPAPLLEDMSQVLHLDMAPMV